MPFTPENKHVPPLPRFLCPPGMTDPVVCFLHGGGDAVTIETGFRSSLELNYAEAAAVHEWLGRALGAHSALLAQNEKLREMQKWMDARSQWLTDEISKGGNFEHLNARRSELAYIREHLHSALSPSSDNAQVKP